MADNLATDQGKKPGAGRNGNYPPKNRQFGQPEGNPRNHGGWKKADTPRYKMEQMFKLTDAELTAIANNPEAPLFERRIATSLVKEKDFKTTAAIINQVYGTPGTGAPEGTIQRPRPEDMVE
jgi:hypothetical protein